MNSGIYQLIIKVNKPIKIEVGKLGLIYFDKGIYIYTGSAKINLAKRIKRHLSAEKKIYWHIDYLLTNQNVKIIKILIFTNSKITECKINHSAYEVCSKESYLKGFGSSDCKECRSHLNKLAINLQAYLNYISKLYSPSILNSG